MPGLRRANLSHTFERRRLSQHVDRHWVNKSTDLDGVEWVAD